MIGDVLSQPAFYLLALGSMCSIAAVGGANQHLKLFLSLDRGYSQADAAGIISLWSGTNNWNGFISSRAAAVNSSRWAFALSRSAARTRRGDSF